MVKCYRLLDYQHAKVAWSGMRRKTTGLRGDLIPNEKGKWLQIEITVEDEGAFTMPWSATVSYGTRPDGWLEKVCAENRFGFFPAEASRCADC
jgi:hypothetical protein